MTPALILKNLRAALAGAADPAKAPQMRSYMKSKMPFHGVQTPMRRRLTKEVMREAVLDDAEAWESLVRHVWDRARFREERYAALQIAGDRRARAFQTPAVMPLYEHLIVTGAWWDFVDEIASHRVGGILREFPRPMKALMRQWAEDGHLWKQRTAILCQLGFKDQTDTKLLYDCIEPSLGAKEFFLQKAVGWALRQYAWTAPREVRRYVQANQSRLSPLSVREALKNIRI